MNNYSRECQCQNDALIIPRYQATRLIVCLLLTGSFVFMGGYFLGQKKSADLACQEAVNGSFSDAIGYSLTKHFGSESCVEEAPEASEVQVESTDQSEAVAAMMNAVAEQALPIKHASATTPVESKQRYQALVYGGPKKRVEQFVTAMTAQGIPLEIRERSSATKKGKKYSWYQAVTPLYDDKKKLEEQVAILKKRGKLNDIRIVHIG